MRISVFSKAITLASALMLCGLSSAHAETLLRVHQFLPMSDSVPREGLTAWAKAIETQSNGEFKVEFYPSMQLGGAPASLFDQARDGVVDLVWTVLGYTPGRFPQSEVFEMPFLVTSGEATSRAFQRFVETQSAHEFRDVKVIAVHTHGAGLFHSKKPIATLEDLKNQKIRGGSRVISMMLDNLGAEAIGMPIPEVPQSLSRGVLDGATMPWQVTLALRSSEIVHNHTQFTGDHGLYTQTFAFVMNKDKYESLTPELKAIIDANSGAEWAGLFGRLNDIDDKLAIDKALDLGNTILTLDEAETARWKAAAQPTIDRWISEARGFDGASLYAIAQQYVAEETAKLAAE